MNNRPTYKPEDLDAQHAWFNPAKRSDRGREVPITFDAPTFVSAGAVATIRRAFQLARTGRDGWQSHKYEGRFDNRAAARATRQELDVFKHRTGESAPRVKVAILIDASGSMAKDDAKIENPLDRTMKMITSRRLAAAAFGATIAKALGAVPTVDLDVYQHSANRGSMVIKWRWSRGTPIRVFNRASDRGIGRSGNADGHALVAIADRMLRSMKRNERGVIMVVSDGLPSVPGDGGLYGSAAGQALIDAVAHCRKHGITVVGVAIDGSDQTVYYGADTIPFTGDWMALGKHLARLVGKALATPVVTKRR